MSGCCGGHLGYNTDRTVSRFQQCPCVVEQKEIFFGTDNHQRIGGLHEISVNKYTDVAITAGNKHLSLIFQQRTRIKPGFGSFEAFEITVIEGSTVTGSRDIVRRVAHGDAGTDQQEVKSFVIDDVANILSGVIRNRIACMDVQT